MAPRHCRRRTRTRGAHEEMARSFGLADVVRFHGALRYDEVTALYRPAAVCVAPSVIGPAGRTEGIPNVMIEALAHGRPAISTRVAGIPELICGGETGWLTDPGDVDGLLDALRAVRDAPGEARRRAGNGRRLVEDEYDLRVNTLRQLALFGAPPGPDPAATAAAEVV